MSKIEIVTSDVDQDERLLHDDELDAVSGGRSSGQNQVKYMEFKLKEVLISSV